MNSLLISKVIAFLNYLFIFKNYAEDVAVETLLGEQRVSAVGKKREVDENRLLVQRAKFAPHVTVLAGVCFGGKG